MDRDGAARARDLTVERARLTRMADVRAPIAALEAGERALDAASAHYVARVLRLRAGDRFVAFDPARAVECDAVLVRADEGGVVARFEAPHAARLVARAPLAWVQGMAKGDKCDAIVRDATELGATVFAAAATTRAVVRLDAARGEARRARWQRIADEASRQCGRGDAPRVAAPQPWAEALAEAAPGGGGGAGGGGDGGAALFCLYEGAKTPLAPLLAEAIAARRALAFAVGPEGGLTEDEVHVAAAAGWVIASVGPFILRTETMAAAVLGAVRVWGGE
jgi:16S rRNA (uracil1498-N3)-methyltransferase